MDIAVIAAYGELVARQRWDWFVTLTFRPSQECSRGGVHPEKADKAFRVLVSRINRHVYGVRWYQKPDTQLVWVRGEEFHKDGRIHFHALFAGADRDLNFSYRRMDVVDWWYREFGIARVEVPQDQADVNRYVAKYSAKGGEVDFSPNFGKVAVVPLDFQFFGNRVPGHKDPADAESLCARVGFTNGGRAAPYVA